MQPCESLFLIFSKRRRKEEVESRQVFLQSESLRVHLSREDVGSLFSWWTGIQRSANSTERRLKKTEPLDQKVIFLYLFLWGLIFN